jgi:hypothetical protein
MRVAPDQGCVHDGCREDIVDILRHQRQVLRRQLPRRAKQVRAHQLYLAGIGCAQSGKRHQRQRLAAAVLPQHSNNFTTPEIQLQSVDQATTGHAHPQFCAAQYRFRRVWHITRRVEFHWRFVGQ